MHSVSRSAKGLVVAATCDRRAVKRLETAQRITVAARRLTVARGLDGFTMEDLAEEAGVSRRTLFNYYPGKDDAVLGPPPAVTPDVLETFVAGGPHHNLVDDLAEIVVRMLRERPESPEEVALSRDAMRAHPRLMTLALGHLQELVESCIGYVETREGAAFDRARFDVALALVVTCLHVSMERFLTGAQGTDLSRPFLETLATAHDLMA